MLKEINGRTFMTGTSEGSLYPVVMMHPTSRLMLGARLEIGETPQPGVYGIVIYARLQKFDAEGNAVPFTSEELFDAVPNSQFRAASALHMSGGLGQGAFKVEEGMTHKAAAKQCADGFVKTMTAIQSKLFKQMALVDEAHIREAAEERYLKKVAGVADETDIEKQLGSGDPFDFLPMLSKPEGSDDAK